MLNGSPISSIGNGNGERAKYDSGTGVGNPDPPQVWGLLSKQVPRLPAKCTRDGC